MLQKCILSRYFVKATPPRVFETSQVFQLWSKEMRVLFQIPEYLFFISNYFSNSDTTKYIGSRYLVFCLLTLLF